MNKSDPNGHQNKTSSAGYGLLGPGSYRSNSFRSFSDFEAYSMAKGFMDPKNDTAFLGAVIAAGIIAIIMNVDNDDQKGYIPTEKMLLIKYSIPMLIQKKIREMRMKHKRSGTQSTEMILGELKCLILNLAIQTMPI
ncbi:MAG: hypothetical protein P1V13_24275 [Rhizobiaceae bacterium]|nr:hypothetical protein [Rhizobiaceae bacterium]